MNRIFSILTPAFRQVLGNAGWLMADRMVRMGFGLVVGVWIARYLGPGQFGSLNFALSFVALFGTVSTLGLDSIVVRHIVLDASGAHEVLGTAFALRVMSSMVAAVLAVLTIELLQPDDRSTVRLVSLLSIGLLFQAVDAIDSYFQSQVQSKRTVWAKNAAFLIAAGGRVYLIYSGAPLWTFAAAQVAELFLGAMGLFLVYRVGGGGISRWRFRAGRAAELLAQSWPVLLSGMAIMIYMRIDMVMLKMIQGDVAVGIYATATRISEVWYFVPAAIVSSVSPAIILSKDDPSVYYRRLSQLFSLMSLMALVAGTGVALASGWIVHMLYSDVYRSAGPVLAVHVWASVFVFLGIAQSPWDISQNLLKLGFYRTLAGAVANVLLNLVLIPRFAAMGAAIATVISYAISAVIANAFDARTRPIFRLQLRSLLMQGLWRPRMNPA